MGDYGVRDFKKTFREFQSNWMNIEEDQAGLRDSQYSGLYNWVNAQVAGKENTGNKPLVSIAQLIKSVVYIQYENKFWETRK